jgi:hypothetical protein
VLPLLVACAVLATAPGGSSASATTGSSSDRDQVVRAHLTALPAAPLVDAPLRRSAKRTATDVLAVADVLVLGLVLVAMSGGDVGTRRRRSPLVLRAPGRAPPRLTTAG